MALDAPWHTPVDGLSDPLMLAALLVLGIGAGILSGLLGIGGGLLMVPVLHHGLGLPWHEATAVSLAAIVVSAPLGAWKHHRRGAVDLRKGALLAAGGAVGVGVGAATEHAVPVPLLQVAFVVVLLAAAWRLQRPDLPTGRAVGWPLVLLTAVVAGVLAKWLGIGGGLVTVPVLVIAGLTPHTAVGTALVAVWTNAVVGTAASATRHGLLPMAAWALPLGAGALLGAPLGVRLAHALPPTDLRRVVAAALVAGAVAMALRAWNA